MGPIAVTLENAVLARLRKALADSVIQTAEEILARERTAALIPMDTGQMQNVQTVVDRSLAASGNVDIVTRAPQAQRLYFNPQYHFRRDRNRNARGEWWEPWLSGKWKREPLSIFIRYLKQNGKELF